MKLHIFNAKKERTQKTSNTQELDEEKGKPSKSFMQGSLSAYMV